MKSTISAIFKTLFLCLCIIANTHFAYAQTASILPQGKTQFLDNNGKPLASGTVDFYIPATTTRKTTWQNSGETIANTNPVVLDAGGRAIIYGDGVYRMVVKDRNNNLIYDQLTSSTGSGSTSPTATGDGDLVGTIKPWSGMVAPSQYAYTYGQEVSRSTYAVLFTAITSSQAAFCSSGSPTITGLSDTTNFWVGMSVELSCVAGSTSTVVSKTSSTVTLAANANSTTNTTAVFFPWGRGNGSTTFNLPDLRGVTLVGNNIMGGVSSSRLTAAYFGSTDPNSSGAYGGNEKHTMTTAEIAGHNHPVFLNDPGHIHAMSVQAFNTSAGTAGGGTVVATASQATAVNSNTTGITVRDTSGGAGTANQTNLTGGGIAASATLGAVGSGYTNGSQTITIAGGTCSVQPQFTVTVAGNIFTGTPALLTAGDCTVAPTNPAATTGGGGTGGTLNVTYTARPISIIQPSMSINYIIKITPDTNSATASGVTSIGGMTGSIACSTGLLCTGNNISVTTIPLVIGQAITGGTDTRILRVSSGTLGEYTISGSGTTVAMANSPIITTPSFAYATGSNSSIAASSVNTGFYNLFGSFNSGTVANASTAAYLQAYLSAGANTDLTLGVQGGASPIATMSSGVGVTGGLQIAAAAGTFSLSSTAGFNAFGTNINLDAGTNVATTINLGGVLGGGVTVNVGAATDGLTALNVYTSGGSRQQWVSGGGNTTITFPAVTDTLAGRALANAGTGGATTASVGGIVWSDASQMQILAGTAASGRPLLSGSLATPSWAAVSYPASATSGGIPYFSSTSQMTSSGVLGANQIVIGGGAGAAPTTFACATSTTLVHGGTPPTCSQLAYADIATAAIATSSEYLAGTSSKLVQAGTIYQAETTTTFGTTTTFDFSTFINTAVTLTGNITTQTLSNVTAGKAGTIAFIQDGTGSRTTVWNSIFKFAGGVTPTLTTTASAVDVLSYSCRSATFCVAFLTKDAK